MPHERKRPTYKRGLLEHAKDAEEPVTEVDFSDDDRTVRVHAIQEADGVAYRVQIEEYLPSDSDANVAFARSRWNSDSEIFRDWTSLATGALSGPQDLPSWESLFVVFNAALDEYQRVRGDDR